MKLSAVIPVIFLFCTLHAAVEIGNGSISVRVLPEKGGRISFIKSGNVKFNIPDNVAKTSFFGFSKLRLFNDANEYMDKPWKVEKKSNRSVTLSIKGAQATRAALAVKAVYTVPEKGNYLKAELTFRNTNPIQGSWKIIPWIHNFFPATADPQSQLFLSHKNGVDQLRMDPKLVIQKALKDPGNWLVYLRNGKGLLMLTERPPESVYSFSSSKGCSMEMLWDQTDPAQPFSIVYYLVPVNSISNGITVPKGVPAMKPAFTLKRTEGKNIDILTYFKNKDQRNIPVDFKFPKECAYVSPDCTLPLVWAVRAIAPGGKLQFEVDLPRHVQLVAFTGNYWWHQYEDMRKASSREVTVKGRPYIRHRFDVTCRRLPEWFPAHYRLLVKSSSAAAKDDVITYRGFHNGRMTMEESVPCKVISIARSRQPRNFKLLMGIDYSLLTQWPGFEKTMSYLGINGVCLNYNVPNKVISREQVRALNDRLHKNNFMTGVMGIFYYAKGFYSGKNADRDVKTLDIDGKPSNSFDFTVRGPWMDTISKKDVMYKSLGFDVMISDYEAYFGGNRLGFTPGAMQKFEKFFRKQYPDLQYIEPRTLVRNSTKYPRQYKIWTQFKCDQFSDFVRTMIEKARKAAPGGTEIGWCTTPGSSDEAIRIDNLMDNTVFSSFLDYNMPMLYNNLYRSMNNYRTELELFQQMSAGKRAKVWPTVTLGFWNATNPFPPEHSYFMLIETAMLQCGGAYLFPGFAGTDNLGVKYLSRALDIIARIDDIYPQGVRQDWQVSVSDCRNRKFNIAAAVSPIVLVKGNKMLLWFAEYSPDPVSFTASVKLPGDCRMTSLTDPEVKGIWKQGESKTFNLDPGEKKAMLLLLETIDGKPFAIAERPKTETAVQNVSEENLLFHDSFDNMKTKGKSHVDKHSIQFSAKGKKGSCLYLKDYESAWIYPEKIDIRSKAATIRFWFKGPSNYTAGKGMLWDLFRCNLQPGNQLVWLYLDPKSGRLSFNIGKKNAQNVHLDWFVMTKSHTDKWPGNIWMLFEITIGKNGTAVTVDGRKEIESKTPVFMSSIQNFQLGRRWVSAGYFDELKIFDGVKK